jgi:hypothetical protein
VAASEFKVLLGKTLSVLVAALSCQSEGRFAAPDRHNWAVDMALVRSSTSAEEVGEGVGPSPLQGAKPPALLEEQGPFDRRWLEFGVTEPREEVLRLLGSSLVQQETSEARQGF